MAIGLHFKDGTTASLGNAVSIQPYPGNDNFVQCLDASSPPKPLAFVPVASLEWAEIDN